MRRRRTVKQGNAEFVVVDALTLVRDPRFRDEFDRRWAGLAPTYYFDEHWNGERGRAVANYLIATKQPRPCTERELVRAFLRTLESGVFPW